MQTSLSPRFNQLIELYYQPMFRFAASLCGTPEAALALTQRTFRRAHEHGAEVAAPVNVKEWLFTLLFLEFLEQYPRPDGNRLPGVLS
jgi:RNA polymerase sigma-70 factor (ECF subfamily)